VWCQVDDLLIGVCYRSPNTDIIGRENELDLRKVINEVSNGHFVITHTVKPGATAETNRFLECLDDNFAIQHVTKR